MQDFTKTFEVAGETGLVDIQVEAGKGKKEKRTVLISNVQMDPISDKPVHVDFHQVDLKEKVTASVPVETLGESPAEKQGVGTVVVHINEVEVEALPMDLPDKFEIDLTKLTDVDQSILVKDLDYDKKKVVVKIDPEEVVVKIEALREEEEEPAPEEETSEGEEEAAEGQSEGETGEGEAEVKEADDAGETKEKEEK
jgi:large subunit ribosomal protein L25